MRFSSLFLQGGFLLLSVQAAPRPQTQSAATSAGPAVAQLHEFEKGSWIDNLAVRPNGRLILTFFDRPEVHTINPFNPNEKSQLVFQFPNSTRVTGIAEYAPDRFAVLVGSRANDKDFVSVWSLELDSLAGPMAAPVGKTGIWGPEGLEGLTLLNKDTLLASDPNSATIYKINLKTGEGEPALNDPSMFPSVNGIRYRAPYLYYTNMVSGTFARIPIDEKTVQPLSTPEVIATRVVGVDDFALAPWADHEAYLVNYEQNDILKVDADAKVSVLARNITAPTAAQFGRTEADKNVLYIVTSGGAGGSAKVHSIQIPAPALNKVCSAGAASPVKESAKPSPTASPSPSSAATRVTPTPLRPTPVTSQAKSLTTPRAPTQSVPNRPSRASTTPSWTRPRPDEAEEEESWEWKRV